MIALAIVTASWVNSSIGFGRMLKEKIVNVVQAGKISLYSCLLNVYWC